MAENNGNSEGPNSLLSPSKGITRNQGEHVDRDDFSYDLLIKPDAGYGISLIIGDVKAGGESPPKRMINATRVYMVAEGSGDFWINDKKHVAKKDSSFVIRIGGVYAFKAHEEGMKLYEVNILGKNAKASDKLYELVNMKPVSEMVSTVSERTFKDFRPQNTPEMLTWISENASEFNKYLGSFDKVIERFNGLDAAQVPAMYINTAIIKGLLGSEKLPTIRQLAENPTTSELKVFIRTMRDINKMMEKGELPEDERKGSYIRYHTTKTDIRNLVVASIFQVYEILAAKREGLEGKFEPDRLAEALMELASEDRSDGLFDALASKSGMNWVNGYNRFSGEFRRQNGFS